MIFLSFLCNIRKIKLCRSSTHPRLCTFQIKCSFNSPLSLDCRCGSDPGSVFQFSFWQNRSFTLLSLYTDMGEPSERCGDINFGVEYEYPSQTLKLKIIQVRAGVTRLKSLA